MIFMRSFLRKVEEIVRVLARSIHCVLNGTTSLAAAHTLERMHWLGDLSFVVDGKDLVVGMISAFPESLYR